MSKLNGTDGIVKIGATVVAELNKWDYTDSVNKVTGRAFGETIEQAAAGARTITGSLSGFYDPTDTNGQATLVTGALVGLDLYPSGDASGHSFKSFTEVLIENVQISSENDNYVPFSASFHANAAPTDEVVA